MTIENADVVDLVGIENDTGKVILSIVDHLDWVDVESHLEIVQEKLNRYIAFFESGEIHDAYPDSKGREVVIALLLVFPITTDERAVQFMRQVRAVLSGIGVEFRVTLLPQETPS
jgi:hypothetical protein